MNFFLKKIYKPSIVLFVILSLLGSFLYWQYESLADGVLFEHETPISHYLVPVNYTRIGSGLEGIDQVFVINLDRRPDKWERMRQILESRNISASRFSAVDGWSLPYDAHLAMAGAYPLRLNGGKLGCFLSHLSIIKDAYEKNLNTIWVMEDDIDFLEKGSEKKLVRLLQTLNEHDPEWDVFYTDSFGKDFFGMPLDPQFNHPCCIRPEHNFLKVLLHFLGPEASGKNFLHVRQRWGMYSYILSRNGMKKIIDYHTHAYVWNECDLEMNFIPKLRRYAPKKDIVSLWHDSHISDTHWGEYNNLGKP